MGEGIRKIKWIVFIVTILPLQLIAKSTRLNSLLISQQQSLLSNSIVNQFLVDFGSTNWVQLGVVANYLATDNYEDADDNNEAIEANDELTAFAQQYYSLYIAYMEDPLIIKDSTYCSAVFELAQACPLQYGDAVFKAQSFYLLINPQIHFQNESACDISQSRMQHTINTVNSSIKVKNKLSNETLAIKVYPNPSTGELQINFADNTIKSQVEVYNAMGMKLLSFNNVNNKTTINLEHLVTGNYILKIISKNSICFKKIAIIK
jgi:hypothetical protein